MMREKLRNPILRIALALAAVLLVSGLVYLAVEPPPAFASPAVQDQSPGEPYPLTTEECLECHQVPGMVRTLPNGDELYLTVDPVLFQTSVHGRQGYACVQCHTDITGFPHPEITAESARDFTYERMQACLRCHTQPAEQYAEGQHAQAYMAGNEDSATCVDCHSMHSIRELSGSHIDSVQSCQTCHAEIYEVYKDSVHGAALLEEFNPDVPTCSDCHENHANTGPDDPGYVLFSPQICADCHTDEELMAKYDLNTDVLDTYLSDFHGTTVTIFEEIAPDQETNKPVCIDCHGVHDIRSPEDAESSVMKDNLADTCERCHPGAPPDFEASWLSHYRPDSEFYPMVYMVNVFYWVVIPGTIGGMVFFVTTQSIRRFRDARKKRSQGGGK